MKKSTNNNTNEVKNEEVKSEKKELSMRDIIRMIDHNTKMISRLSQKIDRLQNVNEDLKTQLKSKIENI